jgi:putative ABC transport system ATP-binding protein
MEAIIETHHLRKTYQTNGVVVEAVRGVDLHLVRGEFVGVMGPSGCGKSTLLHLIGGLDQPSQGDVLITGIHMNTLSESQRAILRRETIGFVFQAYNLLPNLTAADNIELPGLLLKVPSHQVTTYREQLMHSLGISDKANAFPGELSGGEQQRVAIARALINHPTVLLLDEPTGNLDTTSGTEVMELLNGLHQNGQTILLVTHDARVAGFTDRVNFMRDGQLVDEVKLEVPGDGSMILSRLVELEL